MHEPKAASAESPAPAARAFFAPLPLSVWLAALCAALLHLFPVLHALVSTPEGFEFTGNVTVSPDYMQYRAWMRQSQESGPFVENRFTAEPNAPHLPVFFYWGVGAAAGVLDLAPEWVYAVAGSVFALLLSLLLFLTVRWFLPGGRGVWWVFLAILLGGGLGGHLKVLNQWAAVREGGILGRVVGAVNDAPVFESYRSHYLFKSLFDSHFLLLWLLTLASLLAFYFALRRFSVGRAALAAGLCGLITLLHVYEAFTLAAVFAMVVFLCFRRGQATEAALRTAAACCAAMGSVLLALFLVQRSSGLPLPDWTPEEMPFASLALAFPLAWLAITFGFGRWWPHAGLEGCFLMGWLLGSVLLSLSGPYFPYADRAPMALAIPVWILAGLIWHRQRERLGAAQGLCLAAVLAVSPAYEFQRLWKATRFDPAAPTTFLDAEHRETLERLRSAGPRDVLLCDYREYRWLAPEYPGVLHHGHFFLTVNFERKSKAVERFFAGSTEERAAFLAAHGVRFLFVTRAQDPASFAAVPGLVELQSGRHGSLFEVRP